LGKIPGHFFKNHDCKDPGSRLFPWFSGTATFAFKLNRQYLAMEAYSSLLITPFLDHLN